MIAGARIFVTGGTGFLGSSVLPVLSRSIPEDATIVSVARRSVPSSFPRNVTGICANLEDFRSYEDELRAADYLLWMATDRRHEVSLPALWPVNVEPLANTVRVLREAQRLRRLIYVSTISVLDQAGQPSSILDQNSVPAPSTDYGRSKLLAEQNSTEFRPPGDGFASALSIWSGICCQVLPGMVSALGARQRHGAGEFWCTTELALHSGFWACRGTHNASRRWSKRGKLIVSRVRRSDIYGQ